jgi:hypothetical protein
MPRKIIDTDVKMPKPRRNFVGPRSEDRHDAKVLNLVWNDERSALEGFGNRFTQMKGRRGFVLVGKQGRVSGCPK